MGLLSNRIERSSLKPGDHIYSWRTAYVYAHHGIYVGNDKVVHFTGDRGQEVGTGTVLDLLFVSSAPKRSEIPCPNCNTQLSDSHGVVSSCLDCFLGGGVLYCFEYAVSPALFLAKARGGTCTCAVSDPDDAVVRRANHLLSNGFRCYNLFKNNCEDFAIHCKTGCLVAEQGVMGQSGQVISIVGVPLSAVLSTPVSLLAIVGVPLSAVLSTPVSLFATSVYVGGPLVAATAFGFYCASRYIADIGNRWDVVKIDAEDLTSGLATGRIKGVVKEMMNRVALPALPALF